MDYPNFSNGAYYSYNLIHIKIKKSNNKLQGGFKMQLVKNIEFSRALNLKDLVKYEDGQIVSRTLTQLPAVTITLFALHQGEGISTHTTPGDAMVQMLDGEGEITIGDNVHVVKAGETIIMPADIPHSLEAKENFKMLLTVIKRG